MKCIEKWIVLTLLIVFQIQAQGWWNLNSIWAKNTYPDASQRINFGRYLDGYKTSQNYEFMPPVYFDSTFVFNNGARSVTLSWRLCYFPNRLESSRPHLDSLPLVALLHSWQEYGTPITRMLNAEPNKIQYEGSFEDMIVLSFALETVNNLGTWWWGSKINGVPQPWAEDTIVSLIKARLKDACTLLAAHGATELQNKWIDTNRVYLHGHSMGGTGTYRMGIKHPELFAAIHSHAGFASLVNSCGAFYGEFQDMVGSVADNIQTPGLDGVQYNAANYTNMSWFIGTHRGKSWETKYNTLGKYEPPYIIIDHGKSDVAVLIPSADSLWRTAEANRYGYTYFRSAGDHDANNFTHWDWFCNFRKNQSYLAFSNNSTNSQSSVHDSYNFLDRIGWYPGTIEDSAYSYTVTLNGSGTVDITPRRLQQFHVEAGDSLVYWVGSTSAEGKWVIVDSLGLITLPSVTVSGDTRVTMQKKNITVGVHSLGVLPPFGSISCRYRSEGVVTISGLSKHSLLKLSVFNIQGKSIGQKSLHADQDVYAFKIKDEYHLKSGSYILRFSNGNNLNIFKMVIK